MTTAPTEATASIALLNSDKNALFRTTDLALYRSDIPVELRMIIKQYMYMTLENNEEIDQMFALMIDDSIVLRLRRPKFTIRYGPIGYFDLSAITSLSQLFSQAAPNCMYNFFNHVPKEIENWDVSTITDMRGLFYCAYFRGDDMPDLSRWNVSNVKTMQYMFENAKIISTTNQSPNIAGWTIATDADCCDMFAFSDFQADMKPVFNEVSTSFFLSIAAQQDEDFEV